MKGTYENQLAKRAERFVKKEEDKKEVVSEVKKATGKSVKEVSVKKGRREVAKSADTSVRNDEAVKSTPDGAKAVKSPVRAQRAGRGGRPAREESVKVISLAVPESLFPDLEIAALLKTRGNKTAYIVQLIREDIEKNGELYQKFKELAQ